MRHLWVTTSICLTNVKARAHEVPRRTFGQSCLGSDLDHRNEQSKLDVYSQAFWAVASIAAQSLLILKTKRSPSIVLRARWFLLRVYYYGVLVFVDSEILALFILQRRFFFMGAYFMFYPPQDHHDMEHSGCVRDGEMERGWPWEWARGDRCTRGM